MRTVGALDASSDAEGCPNLQCRTDLESHVHRPQSRDEKGGIA